MSKSHFLWGVMADFGCIIKQLRTCTSQSEGSCTLNDFAQRGSTPLMPALTCQAATNEDHSPNHTETLQKEFYSQKSSTFLHASVRKKKTSDLLNSAVYSLKPTAMCHRFTSWDCSKINSQFLTIILEWGQQNGKFGRRTSPSCVLHLSVVPSGCNCCSTCSKLNCGDQGQSHRSWSHVHGLRHGY